MSNLIDFANKELKSAGLFDKNSDYNGMIGDAVLKLIEVFASQGHSGCSAEITTHLFSKLSRYEAISPITGEPDEWVNIGNGLDQNNRCHHVFRQDGQAYDLDGKVFRSKDGTCYTNSNSKVNVTFPYTPKKEFVDTDD